MRSPTHSVYNPAILSVRVFSEEPKIVYVVTENPALTEAVSEFLHRTDESISVVWLTSIASARRRLERGAAAMVIVDHFAGAEASKGLLALRSDSPTTRILVLEDDAVRS